MRWAALETHRQTPTRSVHSKTPLHWLALCSISTLAAFVLSPMLLPLKSLVDGLGQLIVNEDIDDPTAHKLGFYIRYGPLGSPPIKCSPLPISKNFMTPRRPQIGCSRFPAMAAVFTPTS